jgi:pyrophosphatase PpaX
MQANTEPLKAILFDLDGTLINSIDHIVDCWQYAVRACLGREITREEVLPKVGRLLLETLEEYAPGQGEELLAAYRAYQVDSHDSAVTLVSGTRETLEGLKQAGLLLAVVTSKGVPAATMGLNLFALGPLFDALVTFEDTTRHKPNPDPLLVACERLGIEPAQALYVGDAVVDILAGKAAGMRTAGVTWGAGTRESITGAEPDYLFDSMPDILSLLPAGALER